MSTHAAIIEQVGYKQYRGVYLHFDGFFDKCGATLLHDYTDREKVSALVSLGNLSELHSTFAATVAYSRNRGESYSTNKPRYAETAQACAELVLGNGCGIDSDEYVYVFSLRSGKWKTLNGKPLTEKRVKRSNR